MSGILAGKVALISGSARGQGASHARVLAAGGAQVVVTDILDDLGGAIAAEIGDAALYTRLDVRSTADWAAAVELAERSFGGLDILINNAGIVGMEGAGECSDEEWDEVIAVNQTGVFRGTRAAIPALRRAGGGSIVNISSTLGLKGAGAYVAYTASKHAVIGITKQTAVQYGPENIRANAICPSSVDTPMHRAEMEYFKDNPGFDFDKWLGDSHPIARIAEPDEVSHLILYLVSPKAGWVTGGSFSVDGGFMAG
ncbi:MAG TPA: glucose 1-dehydrogenase [Solirubrobacterales bacterium]|nr:glucose 1-dehydrogenase [Solirubrobacterales bacterium]